MIQKTTVSIVVVNWNTREYLKECLHSLRDQDVEGCAIEIIVVDNGSTDGSLEMLRDEFGYVSLLTEAENRGYGAACNAGIRAAAGGWVLILNSDTVLPAGALSGLCRSLQSAESAALCSPLLVTTSGEPQMFGFGREPALGTLLRRGGRRLLSSRVQDRDRQRDSSSREVDWVSGACLLARREVIIQAGLFDEDFFMYFEDVDLCRRVRQMGYQVLYCPSVQVLHYGGKSIEKNPAISREYYHSLQKYYRKHYSALDCFLLNLLLAPYLIVLRLIR